MRAWQLQSGRIRRPPGCGDPLVDGEPLHLRRPRDHGKDDLGRWPVQGETVGDGDELGAGLAQFRRSGSRWTRWAR